MVGNLAETLALVALAQAANRNFEVDDNQTRASEESSAMVYSFGLEFNSQGTVHTIRILDDVAELKTSDGVNIAALIVINNKIDALATEAGISFNLDGTIA